MQQGMPRYKCITKRRENETKKRGELHELPYEEIVKSGTVKLWVCVDLWVWRDEYDRQQ